MKTSIRRRVKLLLFALAVGFVATAALLAWMGHGVAAKPPAQSGDPPAGILISAVYPDGYTPGTEYDEAFRLTNVSTGTVTLTETWQVRDASGRSAIFSGTTLIGPGQSRWCARRAVDFARYFGFKPDLEWEDSDPAVPDMSIPGSVPQFSNDGGQLFLLYTYTSTVDTANSGCPSGWYAGTKSPRASMERRDPTELDVASNWATATATGVGLDANNNPITGTPKAANSVLSGTLAHCAGDVVINEVAWMGTAAYTSDEWIELTNNTGQDIDLNGWTLATADGTPSIALNGTIPANGYYLLERTDDTTVSNIPADQVYTGDLNDSGEVLVLRNDVDVVVDTFVYGDGNTNVNGWSGETVQPYPGYSSEGQILYRKRNESTGLPLPDTDTAADWAQSTAPRANLFGPVDEGDIYGKKVQYPGWDLDTFTQTLKITRTATLTIAVAPDNSYETVRAFFQGAQESIYIEGYTFENAHLTGVITDALHRGISVTMLLEGNPASGMTDQQRWICQQIADAGGNVYLMHNDPGADIHDRYAYQHAKFAIVDGQRVLIGSENFGYNAMPADDKTDGTWGHRGVILVTDAPEVVAHAESIFAADCDPAHHNDIVAWGTAPYTPPVSYTPVYTSGGWSYAVQFPTPFVLTNTSMAFEVVQSPETSLRQTDGLLAMVARASVSDTVLVEQMYEHPYWGNNAEDDPNPRLEAYIAAARRGATVHILLDSYYDEPENARSNAATCAYVNTIAVSETLDLECRLGNPAGVGIHNKMVLVDDAHSDDDYLHVGSLNGTATSARLNRELALQVRSAAACAYLAGVFSYDWDTAPSQFPGANDIYLPLVMKEYVPVANHVLISEVLYDPAGNDTGKEWVELYNPTASTVTLAGFRLGDAVNSGDYERLYQFPDGVQIGPGETLVIAQTATGFRSFGYTTQAAPDYELSNTDDSIPDLIRTNWGDGDFALGNSGDEVLLLDASGAVVDVVVYGTGSYPGVVSFADLSSVYAGNSLERWPANRDSNDCVRDFRVRYAPAPGSVVVW